MPVIITALILANNLCATFIIALLGSFSAAVGVLTNSRSSFPEEYQYSSAGFYHTGIDNFGFLTHLNG